MYIVVRQYSKPTSIANLWKLESRPFKDMQSAEDWMAYLIKIDKKNKDKYFIIFVPNQLPRDAFI